MGTYLSVYLGPYLSIKSVQEIIKEEYYLNKEGNEVHKKFNSDTGEEHIVSYRDKEITTSPNPYIEHHDTLDEDMFYSPEHLGPEEETIFVLNETIEGICIDTEDMEDGGITDLEDIDTYIRLERFKDHYSAYLNHYYDLYGKENIIVKFGLITYYS